MFARYVLKVNLDGNKVFEGSYVSINKAIKSACCFNTACSLYLYDSLLDKSFASPLVYALCKEFEHDEILL